ncbi:MAG: SpoIIE family protein phosphatase [Gammaproteobacteria bacterium]|nr:SpoIIE family protein phosphatase [Gammaproteobacteria bacterium]
MKILIVDDDSTNRLVLSAYLKKDGYTIVVAENGQEAIEVFQAESPKLILMDVMMPVMDGYESTQKIKALTKDVFIPIIFLTAMTDENALSRCVEVGGDDFLTKPYNRTILKAKIDALERVSQLYNTVFQQKRELITHYEHEAKEQEVARKVFDSILNPGCLSADNIQLHLSPMSLFNGDVVLAAVKPTGGLHVLFGDFTGHGLAASLGALPLSDVFYSMTNKGYSITDIVREINHKLKQQLPTGMFLAACLVEIDSLNMVLKYWNGAIPGAFLHKGNSLVELKSNNLPLGILGDSSFGDKVDIIEIHDEDRIVLSTDGILEAENSSGEMFGVERFEQCLHYDLEDDLEDDLNYDHPNQNESDALETTVDEDVDLFQHILDTLEDFTEGGEQTDDVTLGVISCDSSYINQLASQKAVHKKFVPTHWEFNLQFFHDSIKAIDPVPLINQIMGEIQGHQIQQDQLSMVLTELFCNSLDHGLLGLDSSIKSTPEGFMQFYSDKESRLNNLESGRLLISVKNEPHENGGDLIIVFEDSGEGFDVSEIDQAVVDNSTPNPLKFSGRGLSLIKNYCQSVSFNEIGNQITCVYSWSNSD